MKFKKNKLAFSLVELSIVIVVAATVVAGYLSLQTSGVLTKKNQATNDRVKKVYDALRVYVATNKRLPCPALVNVSKNDSASYGSEALTTATASTCATTGVCECLVGVSGIYSRSSNSHTVVYGMLPTKTLNISSSFAEDEFGNKFAYFVDSKFATSPTDFSNANDGVIAIKKFVSANLEIEAANAAFAIVGYGRNQNNALKSISNSTTAGTYSTDQDELKNSLSANFDGSLVSFTNRSSIFDDFVFYKTRADFLQDAQMQFSLGDTNQTKVAPKVATPKSCVPNIGGSSVEGISTANVAQATNPTKKLCNLPGYVGSITYTCDSQGNFTKIAGGGDCIKTCSGGVIDTATVSGAAIHTFTSSGTLDCRLRNSRAIQILVVGGGGSGGSHANGYATGGGGGGGVVYVPSFTTTDAVYSVVVGSGGVMTAVGNQGIGGSASSFSGNSITITADGGGSGGGAGSSGSGSSGGVGGSGGGGHCGGSGGAGYSGAVTNPAGTRYGNSGANSDGCKVGGGGGGAGSAANGSFGGTGIVKNISGTNVIYGNGGNGGNGIGATTLQNPGSGGGGSGAAIGGAGTSGVVIVRYGN